MHGVECPSREKLRAFLMGELNENELEACASHLDTCPLCEREAQTLDAETDHIAMALREPKPNEPDQRPTTTFKAIDFEPAFPNRLAERVGAYEILEELGRGGMGIVYKARHAGLNRIVALKMMSGLRAPGPELRERFRREAEAVARLQHPNIIQLFEAGEHNGLPFFTLEYVAGGSLSHYLAGKPLAPVRAAAMLETIALAVQFAHENGIVHRDLKPANILLSNLPTAADSSSLSGSGLSKAILNLGLKVGDFGLARLAEAPGLTQTDLVMGTPEYMAPEQAAGQSRVGPEADVWSLGALLYTMLAGRPPFQAANALDTLLLVKTADPVSVSRLQPSCPRDLDTICKKCLNKDPIRRYASAAALADDLRCFLDNRPITARPAGSVERSIKWMYRHPATAALGVAVTAALVATFVGTAALWRAATSDAHAASAEAELQGTARVAAESRERSEQTARREMQSVSAGLYLDEGQAACQRGEMGRGLLTFVRALELAAAAGATDLENVARVDLASWNHFYVRAAGGDVQTGKDLFVQAVAFSPDGQTAAVGRADGTVRILDVASGRPTGLVLKHAFGVQNLTFHPDGQGLATGCSSLNGSRGEVRLWNLTNGKSVTVEQHQGVFSLAFNRNGDRLLVVGNVNRNLYEMPTAARIRTLVQGSERKNEIDELGVVSAGSFTLNGDLALTTGWDGLVRIWNGRTGEASGEPLRLKVPLLTATFHPDGAHVATGSVDGTAEWSLADRKTPEHSWLHKGPVFAVAYSGDGHTLAAGGMILGIDRSRRGTGDHPFLGESGGEVRCWRDGRPTGLPQVFGRAVRALALKRDGSLLLTGCDDGQARFFWIDREQMLGQAFFHEGVVRSLALSPDGHRGLTAAGAGGDRSWSARLWELPPPPPPITSMTPPEHTDALSFDSHGKSLAYGTTSGLRIWDRPGEPRLILPGVPQIWAVAFSPGAEKLALANASGELLLWDRSQSRVLFKEKLASPVSNLVFRSDGVTFVTANLDGAIEERSAQTGKSLGTLVPARKNLTHVAFNSDGRFALLSLPESRQVEYWNLLEKNGTPRIWPHTLDVSLAKLADNGNTALVFGPNRSLTICNSSTGQALRAPLVLPTRIQSLDASLDSRTIALAGDDSAIHLYDRATGKPLGSPFFHRLDFSLAVAFNPDGQSLAAGYGDALLLWPIPQRVGGTPEQVRLWIEQCTGLELDAHGGIQELDEVARQRVARRLQELGKPPNLPGASPLTSIKPR